MKSQKSLSPYTIIIIIIIVYVCVYACIIVFSWLDFWVLLCLQSKLSPTKPKQQEKDSITVGEINTLSITQKWGSMQISILEIHCTYHKM